MKLFIVSLVVLGLTCTACIFGTVSGTKTIDELIFIIDSAKSENESVPQNAAEACAKLEAKWEECSFMLSMLLPHHHLDNVKEKLVKLEAYATTEEFAEWNDASKVLKEELIHIRGLVGISIDNIL